MRWPVYDTAQAAIDRFYQDKIIQRLWFRRLTNSEQNIDPAHKATMVWALEPPAASGALWDDLTEWLRAGFSIY